MKIARFIMSGGLSTESARKRRWKKGDHVLVIIAQCSEAEALPGVVVRSRDDGYTVDLDRGGRCYVGSLFLREPLALARADA